MTDQRNIAPQAARRRYGLLTPEVRAAMREMRASGASYGQIGARFGVDKKSAWVAVNRQPREQKAPKAARATPARKRRQVTITTVGAPVALVPRMPEPFCSDFGADIERLETRAAMLQTGDESSRARGQLVRELARGLENAQARAAILAGRRRAVRQRPRANDLFIGVIAA